MNDDFTQIFSDVVVIATVVNTEHFRLAVAHETEHGRALGHIRAEAQADETRNGFSGKLSIIYADEAKGVVRGSVPKQLEAELAGLVGRRIRASVKVCNHGSKVLETYEAI